MRARILGSLRAWHDCNGGATGGTSIPPGAGLESAASSGGAFWEHDGTGEKVREEPECMMRQRHLYYDERLRPVGPPIITEEDKEKGRGTVEGFVSALSDDEVKWWLGELSRLKSE